MQRCASDRNNIYQRSQTIIDVLLAEASGIPIKTRSRVTGIELRPDGTYIVLASVKHGDTRYQERFHTRVCYEWNLEETFKLA